MVYIFEYYLFIFLPTFIPAASASSAVIVIAPLTNMYASLYSHKLDFSIVVLNSI